MITRRSLFTSVVASIATPIAAAIPMKDGLYDLTTNVDWPAHSRGSGQDGFDTKLRKIMAKRVPLGVAPPPYSTAAASCESPISCPEHRIAKRTMYARADIR